MDPLTAMMGASAASSLLGGFMNTSSQQAINAQQLQFAQQQAQGAFMPAFAANAAKAGINPLAALGFKSGGSFAPSPTEPGAGLSRVGAALASPDLMHLAEMRDLEKSKAKADIAQARMFTNRTAVELATNQYVLDVARQHPEWIPSGFSQPSPTGSATSLLTRPDIWAHFWDAPHLQMPPQDPLGIGMGAP